MAPYRSTSSCTSCCYLLILCLGASLAEMAFRCPACSAERQALCPPLPPTTTDGDDACAEIVREPGCGCCAACARREGAPCGVYAPRCAGGLRCYPRPDDDAELPLEQLVRGRGLCARRQADHPEPPEPPVTAWNLDGSSGEALAPPPEGAGGGPKESAVRLHRQGLRSRMKTTNTLEEARPARPKQTQCQLELDQVLERISKMPFRENRGPLEDLYALHIPNCDRRGQYNLKQCKMSLHGRRGECWCVDPFTGRPISTAPVVRGDPNCGQYLGTPAETDPPTAVAQI